MAQDILYAHTNQIQQIAFLLMAMMQTNCPYIVVVKNSFYHTRGKILFAKKNICRPFN